MACLNSFDLIAYPGNRHVETFKANTGVQFRQNLATALGLSGWTVVSAPKVGGSNPGTGFKATSQIPAWCLESLTPDDWKPKAKVWFYPRQTFVPSLVEGTEFNLLNADETFSSSIDSIWVSPTTNAYSTYVYMFVGNPYQFFVFMLGSHERVQAHVDDNNTCVVAGVPQIPKFLQSRDSRCGYGIQDMSFLWQIPRIGPLKGGRFVAIVTSPHGSWINVNTGSSNCPMVHYGGDGVQDALRFYNPDQSDDPSQWSAMLFPPAFSWRHNPADVNTETINGFLWDCVVANRLFTADETHHFDNHDYIAFNEFAGTINSNTPEHALLIAVGGQF